MDNQGRGGRGPYNYNTRGGRGGGRGNQFYNRNKQNSFRNSANSDYRQRQNESEHPQANEVQDTNELTDVPQRSYYGRSNSESQSQVEQRGRGNRGGGRRIQGGRRRQSASSDSRPYHETNRRRSESQSSSSSSKVTNSKVDLKSITPSNEEEETRMLKQAIEESKKTADNQKAFYDEINQAGHESVLSDGEESSIFDAEEEARKIKSFNEFPPLPVLGKGEVVLELLPETNGTQLGNVQSDTKLVPTSVEQSGQDWTLYGAKPKGTVSVPRVPAGRGVTKAFSTDGSSPPKFGTFLNSKGTISVSAHPKSTDKQSEDYKPVSLVKRKVVSMSSVRESVPKELSDRVNVPVTKEDPMIELLAEQFEETNVDPDSISTNVETCPNEVCTTENVTKGSQREEAPVVRTQSSPLLETPIDHSSVVTRLHLSDYPIEMVPHSEESVMPQNKSNDDEQRCVELELKTTDSMTEQITSQNAQPAGISQIIVPYPTVYQYPGIVYQIGFPSPYFAAHMKPAMFPYQNAPPTVISTVDGQLIPTAPIPQHLPVDFGGFVQRFVPPGQVMEPSSLPMENNVDQFQVDYQSSLVSQSQLSVDAVPFSPREIPRAHAPSFNSKPKGYRGVPGHYGPGHQRNYNTGQPNPRNGYGNYYRPQHRHPFPIRNYQDHGMNPLQHSEIQAQDVPNEQFYGGSNFYPCNPYQRQDFR